SASEWPRKRCPTADNAARSWAWLWSTPSQARTWRPSADCNGWPAGTGWPGTPDRWYARAMPAWASTQAAFSAGPRWRSASPIARACAASASPWRRGCASRSPASPPISAGQLRGGRDDVVLTGDDQERGPRQRRIGGGTDHATERARAETTLDDRRDHALAHSGAAPSLVHDQQALRAARLLGDEGLVERHQPAQVDHPHLPAAFGLDAARGAQAHRHAVAIGDDHQVVVAFAIHPALAQRHGPALPWIREQPLSVAGLVQVLGHV